MMPVETHITCPLDKSHRIISTKMQIHLYRCRRNHPDKKLVTCFFDSTHLLDPLEWQHHFMTCPSSGTIRRLEVDLERPQEVGTVPVEEACSLAPVVNSADDDDWNGNYPSYDPMTQAENRSVFRVQIGLSKAKKREYKHQERERLDALEKSVEGHASTSTGGTTEPANRDKPVQKPNNELKISIFKNKDFSNNLSLRQELSKPKQNDKTDFAKVTHKLKNVTVEDDDEKENKSDNSSMTTTDHESYLKIEIPNETEVSVSEPSLVGTGDVPMSEAASNVTCSSSQYASSCLQKHSKKIGPRKSLPRFPQNYFEEAGRVSIGRGYNIVASSSRPRNPGLKTEGDGENAKELGSPRGYDEKIVDKEE